MMEFFSVETLKAVVVLMFSVALFYGAIYSTKRGKKEGGSTSNVKFFFTFMILIAISLPLIEAYNLQMDAKII